MSESVRLCFGSVLLKLEKKNADKKKKNYPILLLPPLQILSPSNSHFHKTFITFCFNPVSFITLSLHHCHHHQHHHHYHHHYHNYHH